MHVVITAGGECAPDLAAAIGSPAKALAPIGTRRCIDIVIAAARGLDPAGIAVVAPDAVAAHIGGRVERTIPADPSGIVNIARALDAFPRPTRLLYLTCDLPFVSTAALADFVARGEGAGIAMALADADAYAADYPASPGHAIRLGSERIANGSVFLIDGAAIDPVAATAGRFFSARKSLPRLALLLGPALLAKFALGRLRISDVEARARAVLGLDARAIRNCAPATCYDIDSLADWTYAHSLALAQEAGAE
jgi:molybdopterin-guanine dinucleotide biosynthesis protein A